MRKTMNTKKGIVAPTAAKMKSTEPAATIADGRITHNNEQLRRYMMSRNSLQDPFWNLSKREKWQKMRDLRDIVSDLRLGKDSRSEALWGLRILERELGVPGESYNSP